MKDFRRRLAELMYGRYGMDELNRVIMYASLLCIVIGFFFLHRIMRLLTLGLLVVLYARMFSRNIYKRQQENMAYLQFKSRLSSRTARKAKTSAGQGSGNLGKRVLICPYCKEKLRVPIGAGKIKISCPHCHSVFEEIV